MIASVGWYLSESVGREELEEGLWSSRLSRRNYLQYLRPFTFRNSSIMSILLYILIDYLSNTLLNIIRAKGTICSSWTDQTAARARAAHLSDLLIPTLSYNEKFEED